MGEGSGRGQGEAAHSARAGVRVTRITLADFRSYAALDLGLDADLVAIHGENGAGKTNLLEALSLFTPGRGLRRAEFPLMTRQGAAGFAVGVSLAGLFGEHRIATSFRGDGERAARQCRIDGANVASPSAFAEFLRIVWLTPDLDGIFRGSAGDRRRFLDRLVLAVHSEHASRVNALERALRSRNRLLEEGGQPVWLDGIEREIAELGVAVAAARRETVERLDALIAAEAAPDTPFPSARLFLSGDIDDLVAAHDALEAEERYGRILRDQRPRDRAAGRALVGPQASDLQVIHAAKDLPAALASTGEQKALLIGLVLAHARLVAAMTGLAPLVLLDEVAAHLDPGRRAALFSILRGLGGQVWLTGADPALFDAIARPVMRIEVLPGCARQALDSM